MDKIHAKENRIFNIFILIELIEINGNVKLKKINRLNIYLGFKKYLFISSTRYLSS